MIVEAYVPGIDYRVLVVDGRMVAAARLRPAAVTGDGAHDIAALIAMANADPRRGDGHARPLTRITLDGEALATWPRRAWTTARCPAAGQVVTLRRNANLSTGGTSTDVTDLVHPEVAAHVLPGGSRGRAGRLRHRPPAGLTFRPAADRYRAARPAGAVIEVNACPGLRMHLAPSAGRRQGRRGRDPRPAVPAGRAGPDPDRGRDRHERQDHHRPHDRPHPRPGRAAGRHGHHRRRLLRRPADPRADASGPRSAEMVLDDPTVEAAVLETARGGIVRRGLGYDKADVAVVTNITADHLGVDGIDDLDDLTDVKALVAEEIQRRRHARAQRRRPPDRRAGRPAGGARPAPGDPVLQPGRATRSSWRTG